MWSYPNFIDFVFSISTFNIGSVGNGVSYFFFMKLSQSPYPGHKFNMLAQIDLNCCFVFLWIFLLHPSTLGWL
jgi:hypothetical protein